MHIFKSDLAFPAGQTLMLLLLQGKDSLEASMEPGKVIRKSTMSVFIPKICLLQKNWEICVFIFSMFCMITKTKLFLKLG